MIYLKWEDLSYVNKNYFTYNLIYSVVNHHQIRFLQTHLSLYVALNSAMILAPNSQQGPWIGLQYHQIIYSNRNSKLSCAPSHLCVCLCLLHSHLI